MLTARLLASPNCSSLESQGGSACVFTLSFRAKGTEIPSPLRLVYTQVLDPRKRFHGVGADGGSISSPIPGATSLLASREPPQVLSSFLSLLSVLCHSPGARVSSLLQISLPLSRRCFGRRGVSSAQSPWLSPTTPGPRAHLRPDRSVSASPRPSGTRSGACWSGGRGPGRGCGPAGAVLGAFLRQSLPGSAGGPARPPLGGGPWGDGGLGGPARAWPASARGPFCCHFSLRSGSILPTAPSPSPPLSPPLPHLLGGFSPDLAPTPPRGSGRKATLSAVHPLPGRSLTRDPASDGGARRESVFPGPEGPPGAPRGVLAAGNPAPCVPVRGWRAVGARLKLNLRSV